MLDRFKEKERESKLVPRCMLGAWVEWSTDRLGFWLSMVVLN